MWMIIITLFVLGATAYIWCTRGFFSSLVHMICVIAAGAIAFGVWELVAVQIRDNAPDRGSFVWLQGAAMAFALALPFAVSLAVLRGFVDKILPANAQCEKVMDYVGGGVCGVVSGVISAGIVVLSLGFLRAGPDFMGYAQANYTDGAGRGSIEKNKGTFVPWVDRIVAGMYSHLSTTTLRTGDPLAKWYPDLATYPGELRVTYDGKSRNSVAKKDVSLLSWYTVGNATSGVPIRSLLSDAWSESPQKVSDLRGEEYTGNYYLAGFTVKFNTSAREKTGSVIFGSGQLRLVVGPTDDPDSTDTKAVHPIAVVCRTDNAIRVDYARFRYDSDTFFSSVGAESEPVVAFEFPVEAGFKPIALYVKGVRFNVEDQQPFKPYATVAARDSEIELGEFPHMGGVGPILDPNTGQPLRADATTSTINATPVTVSAGLGGFVVQKGTEGGDLTITNEDGKGWAIQDGYTKIPAGRVNNGGGLEKALRIDRFVVSADTALVKIVITPSERPDDFVKLLDSVDSSAVPLVEDTNGTTYPPIGYIFRDTTKVEIRYTQATPLKSFGEAPRVTRNTPDKKLVLLFIVNNGVDLREFRIGDVVLDRWPTNRPFRVDMPQRR